MDNIQLFLKGLTKTDAKIANIEERPQIQPLSKPEEKIFLLLYTQNNPVSYQDLTENLNISEHLIAEYVTNLIEKGISIRKEYRNNKAFIFIDHQFKELQAKHNLVGIAQKTLDSPTITNN